MFGTADIIVEGIHKELRSHVFPLCPPERRRLCVCQKKKRSGAVSFNPKKAKLDLIAQSIEESSSWLVRGDPGGTAGWMDGGGGKTALSLMVRSAFQQLLSSMGMRQQPHPPGSPAFSISSVAMG